MKIEELNEYRIDLLENLRDVFLQNSVAAILRTPEEGIPMHILTTLHTGIGLRGEEIMGEFSFLPVAAGEEHMHYFNTIFTLTENMDKEKYPLLAEAAGILNLLMPIGAFVFDPDGGLMSFKYTAMIREDSTAEEAFDIINAAVGTSLKYTTMYADIFLDMDDGEAGMEEFNDLLSRNIE